jgi:AcrR family transcriptional regulator
MLVEAGLACLARGGITAFTIDNICKEAKASRGLIAHHFGSKDGLLAAVYAAAYAPFLAAIAPPDGPAPDLGALVAAAFSDALFARENLNVWLALWGEIAVNPALKQAHRQLFDAYRTNVAKAIAAHMAAQGRQVDAEGLALSFIALIDGYWLEQHIDPERLSQHHARAAFLQIWEPILGKIALPGSRQT